MPSQRRSKSSSFKNLFLRNETDRDSDTSSVSSGNHESKHEDIEGGNDPPPEGLAAGMGEDSPVNPADVIQRRPKDDRKPRDEADSLQPRMNDVWITLACPMTAKLDFLQKYASIESAPLLQDALCVWEQAAKLIPLRERTLSLMNRVKNKEIFTFEELYTDQQYTDLEATGCWVDMDPIIFASPPEDSHEVEVDTPVELKADRREALEAWLRKTCARLTGECLKVVEQASKEFGDHITYRGTDYYTKLK